jgi:hypothetical protein
MVTSGTSSFAQTRDQIIAAAARKLYAIRAGETMNPRMLQDFATALNSMVKGWQARGLHVWTRQEATLFPQVGQRRYALALDSADHATQDYAATTLAADAGSGATTITVDDASDIANGDHIGIVLDDGTLFWTTVNGAPASEVVTLTAALTGAAASDNRVYAYATKIVRPLRVVKARRFDVAVDRETPLPDPLAWADYQDLPNKNQQGTVTQVTYDPSLSTGYLYLWLVPSSVSELINFTWWRPIQDFNAAGDNPDLPQEWIRAITFNLAVDMAPEFRVPPDVMEGPYGIGTLADKYLEEVSGFDREAESVQFGIDMGP